MLILLLCFASFTAAAQPERLFLGDSSHPIRYGEIWIIANEWGASPAILAATIRNGILEKRIVSSFPNGWEQAFEYRLLIGGSNSPFSPPERNETDRGYDLNERFQYFYLSPPFANNWLSEMKRISPNVPCPVRRTVRLLNMDGKPLTGAKIEVSVFGSSRHHCGFAGGIRIGEFVTDAQGRIAFVAPPSRLVISHLYSEEQHGRALASRNHLITGSSPDITLQRWWTLPSYDYVVTVGPAKQGIRAEACLFDIPCGAGCGPVTRDNSTPMTDAAGVLRFHARDVREMGRVTLISPKGRERPLTIPELRALFTRHNVRIEWNPK